jgi:hypothetical protein
VDTNRWKIVATASVTALTTSLVIAVTAAFGATSTVMMKAGDSAHVTCAGPSLAVANQTAQSLDLTCASNPSTGGVLRVDPSGPPPALHNGTNTNAPVAVTTASFSPPAHALLVAGAALNNYAYDYATSLQSVTNSGTPLTWTRQVSCTTNISCDNGGAEFWTATTGAVAPGAITVHALGNATQLSSADWLLLGVRVVTNTNGTTPVVGVTGLGFGAGTAPTVKNVTLSAGSLGFAMVSDWSANGGTPAYGPGLVQVSSGLSPGINGNGPDYAWHYFGTLAPSGGGPTTFNMTAPASQVWDEVVIEAKTG